MSSNIAQSMTVCKKLCDILYERRMNIANVKLKHEYRSTSKYLSSRKLFIYFFGHTQTLCYTTRHKTPHELINDSFPAILRGMSKRKTSSTVNIDN